MNSPLILALVGEGGGKMAQRFLSAPFDNFSPDARKITRGARDQVSTIPTCVGPHLHYFFISENRIFEGKEAEFRLFRRNFGHVFETNFAK